MLDVPMDLRVNEHPLMPKDFLQGFLDFFQKEMSRQGSPGAAMAIVVEDQHVLLQGFGTRNTRKGGMTDRVNTSTVFRIGSLSKGFSSLLAAKLVQEGHFSWRDHVQEYIPTFTLKDTAQAGRIEIQHLLSHSSGLGRHSYTNLTELGLSLDHILPYFSKVDVYGKEGKYFGYQNTAFSMIERVISESTGKSFENWMNQEVFFRSDMEDASFSYQDLRSNPNVALPHQFWRNRGKFVPVRINKKYFNAVSAGGINASISDMAQWIQVLLGNRPSVANQEVLDVIFTPRVATKREGDYPLWQGVKSASYGFGWRILNYNNRDLIYHGGSVNDYRSEIAIDRDKKIGICVLFNAQNYLSYRVIKEFFKRYDQYQDQYHRLAYVGETTKS